MRHNERKGWRTYVSYTQGDANDLLNIKSSPLCVCLCLLNVPDIWQSGSMEDESHSKPSTSTSASLHRHMDSHHIQVNTEEHAFKAGALCFVALSIILYNPGLHTHTQTLTHTDVWTTTAASDLDSFSICWHFDWIGKWAPLKNTYHPWHASFLSLEAGVGLQDWV